MRLFCRLVLPLVISSFAFAAPKLRLSTAAVGPISIAAGQNGAAQTVEAFNIADGALSLQVSSSASWLAASVGAQRNCTTRAGVCLPLNLALNTAPLAKGIVTAIVTVADPNAIDAPQSITVTVQIGGGVPDRLDYVSRPNGPVIEQTFTTNNQLTTQIQNAPWLALSLEGGGTFRFSYKYTIRVSPGALTEGTYNGNLAVTGSGFAPDNKTVPATLRITSQPIAQIAPERLTVVLLAGAKQIVNVPVGNSGLGTITLAAASDSSAAWLTAAAPANGVIPLTVDTAGLNPGFYTATVKINANAVNTPLTQTIDLRVVAAGPPQISFSGIVSNATFDSGPVARGGIASLFGSQLKAGDPLLAGAVPLATTLGGVRVLVNGVAAPLYFVSTGQINFQIPYETAVGPAVVQVERDTQRGNSVSVEVANSAPKVIPFTLGAENYAVAVNQDGSFPWPITAGLPSRPVRAGETLTIYCVGLGQTTPAAVSGAAGPLDPFALVETKVFLGGAFGGVEIVPLFAGLAPNFVGLYQVNITIPPEAPKGAAVPLRISTGGVQSNATVIAIE